MLSVFPELLFLSPFAATLIRVALAILFSYGAWQHVSHGDMFEKAGGLLGGVVAIALFIGAWTQPAALIAAVMLGIAFFTNIRIYPRSTLLLALVMALTLVVTGPGVFAYDFPL